MFTSSRLTKLLAIMCSIPLLVLATAGAATAETPSASRVHDKSQSPPSDLAHYPKRHDTPGMKPAAAAPAGRADALQTVEVVKPLAGGGADVTMYTPPAGMSPDALAAKLRARGIQDVQVVADALTPAPGQVVPMYNAAACSYGTARTNGCPPIHWANNGYNHPQVYFKDHSGAHWPTDQATYTWNQANGIDSWYRWNACGPAGTHCVEVFSYNDGPVWAGLTHIKVDGNRNLVDGAVYIELNEYYTWNADGYRQTICHEEGHALGLDHNVQNYSCLWAYIENSAHRVPDSDDFNMVASVYSVAH